MNKLYRIGSILVLLFHICAFSFAQNFRFALITDIHISKDSNSHEDLARTVESINKNTELGFVIVSGDVTEEGDGESMRVAKAYLDQLNVKYYATAGNHETKWSESGVADFSRVFGSDRFRFEHDGFVFLGFNTGPVIRMMDGHVAPQDIMWLKKELESTKSNQPVVLITHYPLLEGDVDNWYEVTDLARQYNIKVILGGHYHTNKLTTYDGIPAVINRSNLRAKEPFGGYSVYEVTPDSITVSEQVIGQPLRRWGGYSLKEAYFTKDASTYKRPDYAVNNNYPQVQAVWTIQNKAAIYSSPVVTEGRVYIADDTGLVSCFSVDTRDLLWSFEADNRILGTPAVQSNVVVFGSTDKHIYGLDATTGSLIWKQPAEKAVMGAVTIEKDIAYIGASDHTFRAINIHSGEIVWHFDAVKGYVETRPLIYGDKVIFGAWDNNMYALDKETGELAWKWDGGLTRMHFSPAAVWAVAAHNRIYFTAPDRVMTALDASTGQTVWRTKESMVRETIGISEDKTRLYSKTMQDSVVCYSALADTPTRLWITNVGYGYDHAPSMPIEKDDVVFCSTKNGLIFALDAVSGTLLWKHKVGNSLVNTLVPLNARECLFSTAEGIVGLLQFQD